MPPPASLLGKTQVTVDEITPPHALMAGKVLFLSLIHIFSFLFHLPEQGANGAGMEGTQVFVNLKQCLVVPGFRKKDVYKRQGMFLCRRLRFSGNGGKFPSIGF